VAAFFYRELLSMGLVTMSLWAFTSLNRHKSLVSFVPYLTASISSVSVLLYASLVVSIFDFCYTAFLLLSVQSSAQY